VVYNSAKSIINKIYLKMNLENKIRKQLFKTELETHKVELALVDDIVKTYNKIKSQSDALFMRARKNAQDLDFVATRSKATLKEIEKTESDVKKLVNSAKDLGIELPSEASIAIRQLQAYRSELAELKSATTKASDTIFGIL